MQLLLCQKLLGSLVHASSSGEATHAPVLKHRTLSALVCGCWEEDGNYLFHRFHRCHSFLGMFDMCSCCCTRNFWGRLCTLTLLVKSHTRLRRRVQQRSVPSWVEVQSERESLPFTQLLQAPQSAGHVWHVQLLLYQKLLGSLVQASSSGEVTHAPFGKSKNISDCVCRSWGMVSIPFTQLLQAPQSAGHVWHVQLLLCQKLLGSLVQASSSGDVTHVPVGNDQKINDWLH